MLEVESPPALRNIVRQANPIAELQYLQLTIFPDEMDDFKSIEKIGEGAYGEV